MISILVQKTGTIVFAQRDLTWKNWSNVVYARKYGMNARAFLARQGRENKTRQGKRALVQSG